jgi:hypothetical protein
VPLGGFAPLPLRLGGSATEGWAPEDQARAATNLLSVKRTCPLFKITFTTAAGPPTIHALHSAHGVGSAYLPDDIIAPGTGDVEFRWSARRWFDDYEIGHPFFFRHGRVTVHGSTAGFGTVQCNVWGVRVRLFNAAGSAMNAKATLSVY